VFFADSFRRDHRFVDTEQRNTNSFSLANNRQVMEIMGMVVVVARLIHVHF
jgi:hypothetical protein